MQHAFNATNQLLCKTLTCVGPGMGMHLMELAGVDVAARRSAPAARNRPELDDSVSDDAIFVLQTSRLAITIRVRGVRGNTE